MSIESILLQIRRLTECLKEHGLLKKKPIFDQKIIKIDSSDEDNPGQQVSRMLTKSMLVKKYPQLS